MASWDSMLMRLNDTVESTFANVNVLYSFIDPASSTGDVLAPGGPEVGGAYSIPAIPIDPLRLQNLAPGQTTVIEINVSRFVAIAMVPKRGDKVVIPPQANSLTIGGVFNVTQLTENQSGVVRLMLESIGRR